MEKKITYLQNEEDMEMKIIDCMDELNLMETELLLKDYSLEQVHLNSKYKDRIKLSVLQKAGLQEKKAESKQIVESMQNEKVIQNEERRQNEQTKPATDKKRRLRYYAAAAVLLLAIFAWKNSDGIVLAFNKMFGLIPGVGIVEDNQEILYQLKSPKTVENDQGIMTILSAVATKDTMTVSFSFERKNYTEEQMMKDKEAEWERLIKEDKQVNPKIYLVVDNTKYMMAQGSSAGGGIIENYSSTFDLKEELIDSSKKYTVAFEDFNISIGFEMISLEQYSSLDEIGATDIHNNISLTATSTKEENQLQVNVYPINYSSYNLISFEQDYNLEYFGKKISLITENGNKTYTLPGSYGSGMNAAYSFDISDGSKEFLMDIPFVVVETKEESKIRLPIPKVGEVLEVNKEIAFQKGTAIIKSVEKLMPEGGNEYGDLKIVIEYKSSDEKQQLVGIEFTRSDKSGWGWSSEYDEDGRLITINFMLEKSDQKTLKLNVVKPRYVFLDGYQLKLNKK